MNITEVTIDISQTYHHCIQSCPLCVAGPVHKYIVEDRAEAAAENQEDEEDKDGPLDELPDKIDEILKVLYVLVQYIYTVQSEGVAVRTRWLSQCCRQQSHESPPPPPPPPPIEEG